MMQWQFHPPLPSVTEINTFVAAVSSTSQQQTFTQATTASPGQPLTPTGHNRCSLCAQNLQAMRHCQAHATRHAVRHQQKVGHRPRAENLHLSLLL
jgi:hypothetical protein